MSSWGARTTSRSATRYEAAPTSCFPSLARAIELARIAGETEAFIIGGAEIYALALPIADTFYRTRVLADVEGDVHFPPFDESHWDCRRVSEHAADERNEYPFVIETLTRHPFSP
jgi:dihydrofolate reductase